MKKCALFLVLSGFLLVIPSCKKADSSDPPQVVNDPFGMFTYLIKPNGVVLFVNTSENATSYLWKFGDSTSSTSSLTTFEHQYLQNGTYKATLTAYGNGKSSGAYANLNITDVATFSIGQSYQGGIIFYIDNTGKHGLIAAATDQSSGAEWGCMSLTSRIGGTSEEIGTGQANTSRIVNGCNEAGIAARLCDDLVLNGYSDWFLPSLKEMDKMYLSRNVVGGFANKPYWNSTEDNTYNPNCAWCQDFGFDYSHISTNNKNIACYVRAVRAF